MAVYTEVGDQELIAFIAGYAIGDVLSCKGIAEGVENTNYLLHTRDGYFILTLYEKRVAPQDLPFFLGLVKHLAARGVPCPVPVPARDGALLGTLAGRPAAIVTFLEGMWVRRPAPHHCTALGEAMARMHIAGADYPLTRQNSLSVHAWRGLLEEIGQRADEVMPGLYQELDRDISQIESSWPTGLPTGIIHADMFPDNVFFIADEFSGIIDFYFACTEILAYDLGICLNAWCFESDGAFNVIKARAMLSAYRRQRPLGADEFAALPLLARGAALRFLLTRLYDWLNPPANALVSPHDPLEYVRKLRFHRGVDDAREY
ncbi:MAG: homoserine kinase, partial [Hyphomicrobiales bacterium]